MSSYPGVIRIPNWNDSALLLDWNETALQWISRNVNKKVELGIGEFKMCRLLQYLWQYIWSPQGTGIDFSPCDFRGVSGNVLCSVIRYEYVYYCVYYKFTNKFFILEQLSKYLYQFEIFNP